MKKRVIGGAKGISPVIVGIHGGTRSMLAMDFNKYAVHSGFHFLSEETNEFVLDEVRYATITTPDSEKEIFTKCGVSGTALTTMEFYEEPTGGMAGGTAYTPINSNRKSSNVSDVIVNRGVTAPTDNGDILFRRTVGSSATPSKVNPGDAESDTGMILKRNTIYLIKIISGAGSNYINCRLSFVEHVPEDTE